MCDYDSYTCYQTPNKLHDFVFIYKVEIFYVCGDSTLQHSPKLAVATSVLKACSWLEHHKSTCYDVIFNVQVSFDEMHETCLFQDSFALTMTPR